MVTQLRAHGYRLKLRNDNIIDIESEKEITDELIQFVKKNKQQLIHELKKEKVQAIKQLENSLTNQIGHGTYLNVKFEGFDNLIAVCRPEDEEQLKNDGLLTLTTKELAILRHSNTSKETLANLLKTKKAFNGTIANVEML